MIFLAWVIGMTGSSPIQISIAWTNSSSILGSPSGRTPIWSTIGAYCLAASLDQRQPFLSSPPDDSPTGFNHLTLNVSSDFHGSLTEPQVCQPILAM